jgi:signal transduction histidine kinase
VQRQYTIGSKRHKLVARLDVIDDGPGIPPEQQEQIFYPMISGRPDGTGLGLSIAQNIVNQHGGLIECAAGPAKPFSRCCCPWKDRMSRKEHIWVIDDDHAIRWVLEKALQRDEHDGHDFRQRGGMCSTPPQGRRTR